MKQQQPFKWRHFLPDVILLNVRWYSRYSLSYRDLESMMLERGIEVDHTTIFRWVQANRNICGGDILTAKINLRSIPIAKIQANCR